MNTTGGGPFIVGGLGRAGSKNDNVHYVKRLGG